MHILPPSQRAPIINIEGNRQIKPAFQGEPQRVLDSQLPQTGGNEGRLVETNPDDARLERINLNLLKEPDVSLQNQRAVATYNATANMGNGRFTQFNMLDLFA